MLFFISQQNCNLMKKASFTYFKSWHYANALLLGLAILISGFTPGSQPVVELATYTAPINSTCTGNVPIQNLANGMDYTITVGAGGAVDITVTVVDIQPPTITCPRASARTSPARSFTTRAVQRASSCGSVACAPNSLGFGTPRGLLSAN